MRKLVLIILLLSALSSQSQTSVYHPFPDSNAVWNMHYDQWAGCLPLSDLIEDYSYVIAGDTILNAITFHKLIIPYVQSNCTISSFQHSGYKGCIRQDTMNKKVFFIPADSTIEELLYDFNLQVGDTVKGTIEALSSQPDTVLSIDSILVGTNYRKRWFINYPYQIYLIEGIGSTYGATVPSPGNSFDAASCSITCFSQNGQALYPNTTTSCEVILDVKSIPENNSFVSIYPNPFHTTATFTISSDLRTQNVELKILNPLGEIVQQIKVNGFVVVNRKNLSDGIYFYQLINEKKNEILANGKFVIE